MIPHGEAAVRSPPVIPARMPTEVVARYILHPELSAVWTEGASDRRFFSWHFHQLGIAGVDVNEIGDLDVASVDEAEFTSRGLFRHCRRDELIVFSCIVASAGVSANVVAVADRDRHDRFLGAPSNANLLFTDFRDLLMYAFDARPVAKLFGLPCGFAPDHESAFVLSSEVLAWLSPLLRELCALHDAMEVLEWRGAKVALRKYLAYDKAGTRLAFDRAGYVRALLATNNQMSAKATFEAEVSRRLMLPGVDRHHIRGHTFLEVLEFFLLKRLGSHRAGVAAGLCQGLMASLETAWLTPSPLFLALTERFGNERERRPSGKP